jgi:hypothetical protein
VDTQQARVNRRSTGTYRRRRVANLCILCGRRLDGNDYYSCVACRIIRKGKRQGHNELSYSRCASKFVHQVNFKWFNEFIANQDVELEFTDEELEEL